MRYKKTTITVKISNSNTYPNLRKNWPYSCKIKDKDWPANKENILTRIAEYLLYTPYSHVVLKNKIPEEKALGKALDDLVEEHNDNLERYGLTLKLGKGAKFFRLIRARKILKMAGE
jgi:hypothetical protein